MLYSLVKVVDFHESLAQEEVTLQQIPIDVEGAPTILAAQFPSLQFQVAEGSVCEVCGVCGVLYLHIIWSIVHM